MLLARTLLNRKGQKYEYSLTIHHIIKLSKNGIILYVGYRRGRKWNGETKKAFVKDKTATFDDEFKFTCRMENKSPTLYRKKDLDIFIYEVNTDGIVGKLKLNLADYTKFDGLSQTKNMTIKLFDKDVEFKFKITCTAVTKDNGGSCSSGEDSTFSDDLSSDASEISSPSPTDLFNALDLKQDMRRKVVMDSRAKRVHGFSLDFNAEQLNLGDANKIFSMPKNSPPSHITTTASEKDQCDKEEENLIESLKLQKPPRRRIQQNTNTAAAAPTIITITPSEENERDEEALRIKNLELAKMKQKLLDMERQTQITIMIDKNIKNQPIEYDVDGKPMSASQLYKDVGTDYSVLDTVSDAIITACHQSNQVPIKLYWMNNGITLLQKYSMITLDDRVTKFKNEMVRLCDHVYRFLSAALREKVKSECVRCILSLVDKRGRGDVKDLIRSLRETVELYQHINPTVYQWLMKDTCTYINQLVMQHLMSDNCKHVTMGTSFNIKINMSAIDDFLRSINMYEACRNCFSGINDSCMVMMMNKTCLDDPQTRSDTCPNLTIFQLQKILFNFRNDEYDPDPITLPSVIMQTVTTQDEEEIQQEINFYICT
ncbi:myoH [Acrasis kona]|uniref:MyoH n=1 Tax=Acrasis kona TaxID=1008807 RepID=A0AAW2ZDU2_9EUKA